MASKKKPRATADELKQEEVLQAVVVADTFDESLSPLTNSRPRALLPVANTPVIDYTLECLLEAGVQDIFIFCKDHADQLKQHINTSKWSSDSLACTVTVRAVGSDVLSLGDILREVDSTSLVKNDFILVTADVVSNVDLKAVLAEHRERKKTDKSSIMTLVFKKGNPGHRSRGQGQEVMLATKAETGMLIGFARPGPQRTVDLPLEVLQEEPAVVVRNDLLDPHISICSTLVPQLFTDNFDYLNRDDFIKGILENEEILGNTMHIHIAENHYAARVSSLHMYDAVSKDVMGRWSYPYVPDNTSSNECTYKHSRHHVYTHTNTVLARNCKLKQNVVVGADTTIGSNSSLEGCVVGNNCQIGENVDLQNCQIWDNVVIGNDCTVNSTVLCDGVVIKPNVKIMPKCVIAQNVVVGPDITLPSGTMLVATPVRNDDDFSGDEDDDTAVTRVCDKSVVGSEGEGYVYVKEEDSDMEEWESESDVSSLSSDEEVMEANTPPPDDAKLFYTEVLDTLERCLEENITLENTILEINSLKHAYNIQIQDVNNLVVKAVVELPMRQNPDIQPTDLLPPLKKNIAKFLPIFKNYIRSRDSRKDCLQALEEFYSDHVNVCKVLSTVLSSLYNEDVLDEDTLISWYSKLQPSQIKTQVAPFIKWLEEADEETDEDSD